MPGLDPREALSTRAGHVPRQRGLSLIELMVALVAGLIFSLGVLLVQSALTRQNVVMSDTGQRDDQSHAALDLVTRDLSNAGFMLGGAQSPCSVNLAYNGGVTSSQSFAQYPISAASQPADLPTTTAPGTAPYASNLPTPKSYGSSAQFTDMVMITQATSALQGASAGNPSAYVVQNSTANSGGAGGAVSSTRIPLGSTAGISAGDNAILRMVLNGKAVCFRIPIVNVGPSTAPASTYIDSKGGGQGTTLFPPTGYGAFNNLLIAAGALPPGGSLTNANLVGGQLQDVGPPGSSNLQTVVYYIGQSTAASGGVPYPLLMRAVINAANESLVSLNPVAAGVVSLQVLFGVDETNSGGVTNYLTWPAVLQGNFASNVRSVLFGIITRSLHADPKYTSPGVIAIPSPATAGGVGPGSFTPYTVPAAFANFRFSVLESEIAVRNLLWQ